MKVRFLGYGSNSFGSINTVSFLLYHNESVALFDCGTSVTNNLHAVVPNFCDITHVYISHSHFDHFLGLPYFIIGRHLDGIAQKKNNPDYIPSPLKVYIPEELIDVTKNLISICHKDVARLSYEVEYYPICAESDIDFEGLKISPFASDHTVATYGAVVKLGEDKLLGYSSDTLYNEKIIDALRGCRYLVLEGMVPDCEQVFSDKAKHATFSQMTDVVGRLRPEMAFVVHLQPRYLSRQAEIAEAINCIPGSKIVFPEIGETYVLRV